MLADHDEKILLRRARQTIAHKLQGQALAKEAPFDQTAPSQGVFVTLKKAGNLRGCIGHLQPQYPHLMAEIDACAIAAAFADERFPPVKQEELAAIKIELSLLEPAEPIESIDQLDPKRFGIIVRSGLRQGTLLPDIEGVDTATQQIQIAKAKAGIRPDEPAQIFRYRVKKFTED